MKTLMVRYRVKTDKAPANEAFIRAVFEQLRREAPAGIRYASFKLDDGVSFVHIASIEAEDGPNPLTALASFKAFVADIKDRCDEPPVAAELEAVGTYRFFDR